MDELLTVKVDKNFKDCDKIERIYIEAFPKEERAISFGTMLNLITVYPETQIYAYYDKDLLVGFTISLEKEKYSYIFYFAIDSTIRSNGYGGKIIDKYLLENKNKTCFGFIEVLDENSNNYEQRVRRAEFYRKHNYIISDFVIHKDNADFTMIISKDDANFKEYVDDLMAFCDKLPKEKD